MNKDYVLWWWQRDEFAEQIGDWQATASYDQPGSDLLADDAAVAQMQRAPLKEPLSDYDVRATFDSRFINGYDFNFAAVATDNNTGSGTGWEVSFNVPVGYRAIPRKWSFTFDALATGPAGASLASLSQAGAAVPNNQDIIIGMGGVEVDSFYLCEENTTFGAFGKNSNFALNTAYTVNVNVYGNLIPVSDVALPLTASNPRLGNLGGN